LQPDLVHLQMPWPGGDAALLGCDVPYVVTYQSDVVRQQRLLTLYAPLLHRTLRHARAIITTSPQYRDSSPWLRPYLQKCRVIPLGMHTPAAPDPTRVAYWRAKFPQGCVLWVGRMRYYKGLEYLVAALAHTPESLQVVLVGDGPMAAQLTALAHAHGVSERLHLVGALADSDVRALQAVARVFVFPSHLRAEAFGLALLEAMFAGLPAITCEVGTATSFVNRHQVTGLVIPPADVPALRDALTHLWEDETRRSAYAHNATHWATAQFAATQMVADTLALYYHALQHP
jgi:rhamnosyl/mannosyltransferase